MGPGARAHLNSCWLAEAAMSSVGRGRLKPSTFFSQYVVITPLPCMCECEGVCVCVCVSSLSIVRILIRLNEVYAACKIRIKSVRGILTVALDR